MKISRPYTLKERIYQLCIREHYFNAGTNEQYNMMFYAACSSQFTVRDVAIMISICSICADVSKVEQQLQEIIDEIEAGAA